MAVKRDVVVVEHVRGDAVDQGGGVQAAPLARWNERGSCAICRGADAQLPINERSLGIARAGDQYAKAVGDAGAGCGNAFGGNLAQVQAGNKTAEIEGE